MSWLLVAALLALAPACSVKRFAINKLGDAIAGGGSSWHSDDDLELVGDALPFSLKLVEGLLQESPRHRGLLQTACEGFTTYANVYVHHQLELAEQRDLAQARRLRERCRRLYLRAHGYCQRGLELSSPGIGGRLELEPVRAVSELGERELPLIYWGAASLGLAISVAKDDAAMLARLPEVEALVERGLELDEGFEQGAFHEFRLSLTAARGVSADPQALRQHYRRALDLSGGRRASLFVAYAEAIALPQQDLAGFELQLERALAIDPDTTPEHRLAAIVAQRRASWLLGRADELFLAAGLSPEGQGGER